MNRRISIIQRWQQIIRSKASTYEHKIENQHLISSPRLDDIANEMEAFLAGLSEIDDDKGQLPKNNY